MTGKRACAALCGALAIAAAGRAAADEAQPWRHGIIKAKSDAGIFMMIKKGGFAEKQGLTLDIQEFGNDVIEIQAILSGGLDSYDGSPGAAIAAAARGADIKVLGCEWPGVPYVIYARPAIKTIQDLKGKTMAISAPGASPDVVAHAVLAKYGIPVDAVHFANLGADLDRFKAVVAGVADATVVSNEYAPIAEQQGLRTLLRASEVVPDYMRVCIFTTAKVLASRRQDAAHFLAAEMQSLHYVLGHRDEVIALTRATIHAKPDDARPAFMYDDSVKTKSIDPAISIPVAKLQWMEQTLLKSGTLKQPYDVTKMIDAGPREAALALAGK
ncbi:MAG TPA: ABC transporter substrate-binding protein [Stellaceae bacterium]|nr:ABC transporter substrate-binding protein [Stellaceae bacterium]